MEKGKKLDQKQVAEEFGNQSLELTSFKTVKTLIPTVTYTLEVEGTG
jgi:hypothetical protein